jgi:hypothetical protein
LFVCLNEIATLALRVTRQNSKTTSVQPITIPVKRGPDHQNAVTEHQTKDATNATPMLNTGKQLKVLPIRFWSKFSFRPT